MFKFVSGEIKFAETCNKDFNEDPAADSEPQEVPSSVKATTIANSCPWLLALVLYLYKYFLVATGFYPFYHCRLIAHACGFNLLYSELVK